MAIHKCTTWDSHTDTAPHDNEKKHMQLSLRQLLAEPARDVLQINKSVTWLSFSGVLVRAVCLA